MLREQDENFEYYNFCRRYHNQIVMSRRKNYYPYYVSIENCFIRLILCRKAWSIRTAKLLSVLYIILKWLWMLKQHYPCKINTINTIYNGSLKLYFHILKWTLAFIFLFLNNTVLYNNCYTHSNSVLRGIFFRKSLS